MRHCLMIVASLLISTVPLSARQQQSVAKLKTDTRNAVGTIGGDKAKTQTYCQILVAVGRLHQVHENKDQKKANALVKEIVQLQKQLPEFGVLSNAITHVQPNSPDGQEIASVIRTLNQECEKFR
jgi:predicted sulfurtransferase